MAVVASGPGGIFAPAAGTGPGGPKVAPPPMVPAGGALDIAAALPATHVAIQAEHFVVLNRQIVVARLDDTSPALTAGYGGQEVVSRPQRRAIPVWRGTDAPALTLGIMLDEYPDGSVEHDFRTLEVMAGGMTAGDPPPARLVVVGKAVPHCQGAEAARNRWVINELTAGTTVERRPDGHRSRLQVTLKLLLDTEPDALQKISPRQGKPTHQTYVTKKGDTYNRIAATKLGTSRLGKKLAVYNAARLYVRDPAKALKANLTVWLPVGPVLAQWKADIKQGHK